MRIRVFIVGLIICAIIAVFLGIRADFHPWKTVGFVVTVVVVLQIAYVVTVAAMAKKNDQDRHTTKPMDGINTKSSVPAPPANGGLE